MHCWTTGNDGVCVWSGAVIVSGLRLKQGWVTKASNGNHYGQLVQLNSPQRERSDHSIAWTCTPEPLILHQSPPWLLGDHRWVLLCHYDSPTFRNELYKWLQCPCVFVCFSHRRCCRECSKQAICQKWQCYPPVRQEISYWICDVMEAGLFDTTWVSWIIKWHIFLFLLPRLGNNRNILAGVLAVCRHFHSNCSVNNSYGREDKSITKPWLLSSKWEGNLRNWTFVFS